MKTSASKNILFPSFLLVPVVFTVFLIVSCSDKTPAYKDASLPVEKRVQDLIKRMTLEEKIRQFDMYWGKELVDMKGHEGYAFNAEKTAKSIGNAGIGSVHDIYPLDAEIINQIQKYALEKTRLGIPVLFIEEGLHGYCGYGSTTFPIPLQLASAWDTSLVYRVGRTIGTESRAHGITMILGPVLDLARDARWGRSEETYGEDPVLVAQNGVAMVRGMQGKGIDNPDAVIAEPKHFAVHSVPEAGSNIAPVFVGEREARSSFFVPFEKAVKEGGAMGIMAAYHELDGIPCASNPWLLTEVLRNEWGFKGFVLSDLGAIRMTANSHMTAADTTDALVQSIKAGMNMQFYDFTHETLMESLTEAIKSKKLSESELDKAVAAVLKVKFLAGLFENPYINTNLKDKVFHTEASQQLALEAAQKSIVLLKNENSILPIDNKYKSIAVIGELATSDYAGGYTNPDAKGISILDGLKSRVSPDVKITYVAGYSNNGQSTTLVNQAVATARSCDIAIVVLGEDLTVVGEGKDRSDLQLDAKQLELIKAIKATGKPVAVVLFNGRPLAVEWVASNIPSILETWFSGEKGGLAIADVLLGNVNPSGKLPVTFPRSVGQVPYYYNHKPSSKHIYVDVTDSPLFPFGHGLSYTTFEYSGLEILNDSINQGEKVSVSITVSNTGKVKGEEVVQLYLRDKIASVTTPVTALKAFQKIELKPGESKKLSFELGFDEISLWNREMQRVVEPGEFIVRVGSSSADIRAEKSFWVTE